MTSAYSPVEIALSINNSSIQSVAQGLIGGMGQAVGQSKQAACWRCQSICIQWMSRIPTSRLEELSIWKHHRLRPRGGRASMGGWLGEGGVERGLVGRGCTVPGLAAILRTRLDFRAGGSCRGEA